VFDLSKRHSTPMQSWREGLGEQLKQRNARERDVFVQIVAACTVFFRSGGISFFENMMMSFACIFLWCR
jgi:hypothetical protein